MKHIILPTILSSLVASSAYAKPVGFADSWQAMTMNDHGKNALHLMYSPTADYSLSLASEFQRKDEGEDQFFIHTFELNYLAKRWNFPDSQANIYLNAGAGFAEYDGKTEPAFVGGILADWEDRRWFVSYENELTHAGDFDQSIGHAARVGIAPYVGEAGDLHTWLMLQVENHPTDSDLFVVTPLVRMFYGPYLWEAGVSHQGDVMFNATAVF